MISLVIAVIIVLGIGGTVAASDSARPGDLLFPVDRFAEDAHLALTADADAKAALRAQIAEERADEIESLVKEESAGGGSAEGKARIEAAFNDLSVYLAEARASASSTALDQVHARVKTMATELESRLGVNVRMDTDSHTQMNEGTATTSTNAEVSGSATSSGSYATSSTGVDLNVGGTLNVR
jgi:hypothetical protein